MTVARVTTTATQTDLMQLVRAVIFLCLLFLLTKMNILVVLQIVKQCKGEQNKPNERQPENIYTYTHSHA